MIWILLQQFENTVGFDFTQAHFGLYETAYDTCIRKGWSDFIKNEEAKWLKHWTKPENNSYNKYL